MFSHSWNDNILTLAHESNETAVFEDLFAQAAQNFPPDGKPTDGLELFSMSALSPFASSSSSGSSSGYSPCSPEPFPESDHDNDTEIHLEVLAHPFGIDQQELYAQSLSTADTDDAPFLPPPRHGLATPSDRRKEKRARPLLARDRATVRSTTSHPPTHLRRSSVLSEGSDLEADIESEEDPSDDEYMPSPTLIPRKRARALSTSPRTQTNSPAPSSSFHYRPSKRARLPPPSRNTQAISPSVIRAALAAAKHQTELTCVACNWKQTNGRMPDFKRHLKTHLRPDDRDQSQGWWCKGVLLKDAAKYGVPSNAKRIFFAGQWRVGGCERTFSRRDALKRHLDNGNVTCIGKPCDASED